MRSQSVPVPGREPVASGQGGLERSPLEKAPVQPGSLRQHPLWVTPVSRRSLKLAGRGKQALREGQAWQSKVMLSLPHSTAPCLFLLSDFGVSLQHTLLTLKQQALCLGMSAVAG